MTEFLPIKHPRFLKVQRDIFVLRLAPNCMTHECRLLEENGRRKLDACCQYGVDVDTGERDGILKHRAEIQKILSNELKEVSWFSQKEIVDEDFPSGSYVRTATHNDGCVFLSHDARGCAIHRASLEGEWDFHGIKPNVCRLFPVSYDNESIVMSDDYAEYSCAIEPNTPTVYQVARPDLEQIFGDSLVKEMDRIEKQIKTVSDNAKKLDILS